MFTAAQLLDEVNDYLEKLDYSRFPQELYEPVKYVLSLGGKRIRPLLMLMSYELFQRDIKHIMSQAAGIEIYHNFTLLHDDLMDCADKRRGHPTVHIKWDNNTAVLSGDAMTIIAYRYMSACNRRFLPEVLDLFSETALQVCEGQELDMLFETRMDVTEEEYIEMIRLKTAVLLACSLKIGALLADATPDDAQRLYDFGIKIGLAFQLQDDYLDVYGNTRNFGKNIGGDIVCNKKSYLLIKALETANAGQLAELKKWLSMTDFKAEEKIAAVTAIYNELKIPTLCEKKIREYYAEGMELLDEVSVVENKKGVVRDFVRKLMLREM